tara:strand:+ start:12606 stop:13781 length:1176 start_codon:yes stop_codon:yes gene_type:complete
MQQFSQKRFTSTTISDAKEIHKSVSLAKKEIKEILSVCISGSGALLLGSKSAKCCPIDFLRTLSEWPRKNFLDISIRNIILSSLFSSETKQGGSALISAMMMLDDLEVIEKKKNCTEEDIISVIDDWAPSGISNRIGKEAFYMGACGSEVKISEGVSEASRIKCSSGISQRASIAGGFSSKNLEDFCLSEPCYVVAVDGFVENLSQIHHLLESIEDHHLILMARSFLPDVVSTLSANYPRRLKCIPVTVSEWLAEDFLYLEKLGVSCVSSEAGMEISNSRLADPISISLDTSSIIFENKLSGRKRKIFVEVGKDLGDLNGLTIDRVKTLITLSRFTSRSGIARIRYKDHEMHVPISSYEAAIKCKKSLEKIFQEIGGIIAIQNRGGKHEKH